MFQGESRSQTTFDLSFYPDEKGPYNDSKTDEFISDKKNNWAAITKSINTTNFKKANVEYIQFWMLDDFGDYDSMNLKLVKLFFT